MVTLDDVLAAQETVAQVALRTPILPLKKSDRPDVHLKCENLQRTGAFKLRGAWNRISKLPADCPGVVASSSGNHAQGVAYAARTRGLKAVIVMLDQSVPHKVEATRALGAEVIFGGTTSVAIGELAAKISAERGYVFIPPFNDPDVIAGQGTVGLEILQDLPGVRSVVVPVGGGGLSSGISVAVKETDPSIRVFGVEPAGAAKMRAAFDAGKPVALSEINTIADGLMANRAGELTLEHLKKYLDGLVTVTDEEILDSARHLILQEKLVAEPSGAAALAAVRTGRIKLPDGPVAVVVSGGNADLRQVLGY